MLDDLFSSVLSQFKKYHPSGNMKFNNFDVFQSLKLRNLMGEILRISLMPNFTPNTLGCYGSKTNNFTLPNKQRKCQLIFKKLFRKLFEDPK